MKRCPTCGATYDVVAGFCPNDGASLLETGAPAQAIDHDTAPRRVVGGAAADGAWHAAPPSAQSTAAATAAELKPGAQSGASPAVRVRYDEEGEELLLGTILAERYRIDARIGAGGMGVVYRGVHVAIDKPVAIKVLRSEYAEVEDVAARFELEARVASKISHPNVVDISDYGQTPGGSPYYVMELLAGKNLGEEIDDNGALDPERAVGLARSLAYGLGAAHSHGVVHRDLKPDNIVLLEADGGEVPKILDFGIARVKTKRTRLTAAGSVVGTPEYMAPEQAQGHEVDARSDIYSLGAILFEMLTGEVPLRGATLVETLTKQVYDTPPLLRTVAPQLADYGALEELLARTLSKNAADRPETASAFADALARALPKELGKASESSERLKATVAMGSWSVGDKGSGGAAAPEPVGGARGPRLNQGVPPPMGFANTPSPVGPAAAPAPASSPLSKPVPVAAATPAAPAHIPPSPSHRHGHHTRRPTQVPQGRSWSWPAALLIGSLGAVGIGFGVVAIFRVLGGDPATPTPSSQATPPTAAEAQMEQVDPGPSTSAVEVPGPTGADAASGASGASGATGPRTGQAGSATGATGEAAVDPVPEKAPEPTKKSTKKKKKKKKASAAVVEMTPTTGAGVSGTGDTKSSGSSKDPETGGSKTDSTKKPKDPPPDPGVSLGDLRDPFG